MKDLSKPCNCSKDPYGPSHHNTRVLVDHQRQLADHQIKALIGRDAVIGGVLDAWMLSNNWKRGVSNPEKEKVTLDKLVDHYDHICQIAGNSLHIAIGSDLDGMFGKEQAPYDMDTIADLQGLAPLLRKRGYSQGRYRKHLLQKLASLSPQSLELDLH